MRVTRQTVDVIMREWWRPSELWERDGFDIGWRSEENGGHLCRVVVDAARGFGESCDYRKLAEVIVPPYMGGDRGKWVHSWLNDLCDQLQRAEMAYRTERAAADGWATPEYHS